MLKRAQFVMWRKRHIDVWKDEVRVLWPHSAALLERIERREQLTFARHAHRAMLMSGLFGFPLAPLGPSIPDYEGLLASSSASESIAIASSLSHS